MDIFSVLIVIVVMAIAVFKQSNKNKGAVISRPTKKQVASSSFVEEIDEEEKVPSANKSQMQHSAFREEDKKNSMVALNVPDSKEGHEPDVSFRTPADARRAFIYSEIFGRKYD